MSRKTLLFVGVPVLILVLLAGIAVAQVTGDPEAGKAAWEQTNCQNCHGAAGEGKYAGPRAGDGKSVADWIKQSRTPRSKMPAYSETQISDQVIADMNAYMQTLAKPAGFSPIKYEAAADDPAGKVLLNEKRCIACHAQPEGFVQQAFVEKGREVSADVVVKQLRTPAKWMPMFTAGQVSDAEAGQIAEYLASLAGQGAPVVDPNWAPAEPLEGTVGIIVRTMVNDPFQVAMAESAQKKAEALGLKPLVYAATGHGDVQEQQAIVEDLIQQQVNGILLAPLDTEALKVAMESAAAAGIPVVLFDSNPIEGAPFVTAIGTDNIAAASIAADYLIEKFGGTAKVAQLEGEPGAQNALFRVKGFQDRLAEEPGMEVVASQTGHWTTAGAMQAAENIIQAHPDINAIFASSDMMGVGAVEALRAAGRLEDVTLVTFDGIPDGIALIKQGVSDGDVAQYPTKMGEMGIVVLGQLISGEKTAADYPQYIDSGAELVTPETADQFLLDTFGIEPAAE